MTADPPAPGAPTSAAPGAPTSAGRGRREYAVALGLLAAGAALVLVAAGQTWGTATAAEAGLPALSATASGRDIAAEVAATGIIALAGIAGLLATGRVGRVVVGAVLVLAGLVAVVGSWTFRGRADGSLAALLADKVGAALAVTTTTTAWWAVSALGGALVVAAGLLAVVRGGRWPRMGARYERGDRPATAPDADESRDAASTWAALDRGEDPTV